MKLIERTEISIPKSVHLNLACGICDIDDLLPECDATDWCGVPTQYILCITGHIRSSLSIENLDLQRAAHCGIGGCHRTHRTDHDLPKWGRCLNIQHETLSRWVTVCPVNIYLNIWPKKKEKRPYRINISSGLWENFYARWMITFLCWREVIIHFWLHFHPLKWRLYRLWWNNFGACHNLPRAGWSVAGVCELLCMSDITCPRCLQTRSFGIFGIFGHGSSLVYWLGWDGGYSYNYQQIGGNIYNYIWVYRIAIKYSSYGQ